jgi:predicted kinase
VSAVVQVNGIPGSGKSTLSRPLAAELGFPLISKDTIKESLYDSLGIGDRSWSQTLGRASIAVMWSLVPTMAGPVLLESNWWPEFRALLLEDCRVADVSQIVEVWCEVPADVAFARYAARAETNRHPGHVDQTLIEAGPRQWREQNVPLNVGPLLRVPTDRLVDIPAVAGWVRDQLGSV